MNIPAPIYRKAVPVSNELLDDCIPRTTWTERMDKLKGTGRSYDVIIEDDLVPFNMYKNFIYSPELQLPTWATMESTRENEFDLKKFYEDINKQVGVPNEVIQKERTKFQRATSGTRYSSQGFETPHTTSDTGV